MNIMDFILSPPPRCPQYSDGPALFDSWQRCISKSTLSIAGCNTLCHMQDSVAGIWREQNTKVGPQLIACHERPGGAASFPKPGYAVRHIGRRSPVEGVQWAPYTNHQYCKY